VYVVVAWGVLQASDLIAPRVGLPDWTVTFVIVIAALGLPIALVLAWLYDIHPDAARAPAGDTNNRRALAYLGIGIVIALVGFAAYSRYDRSAPQAPPASTAADPNVASIAVLPFVNMSADPNQEYFSDGLTEELLNALAQVRALRVAARTSSFSFKGKNLPVAEIARALNVKTVLEGSVRKAGNRVRITAQLINASDGFHIWSQTFDRELTDIFAIQEEISRSIASALQLRLAASDSVSLSREQHDLSAYDLYLQARFFWNQRTESSLRQAQVLLERAIQIDPTFARAYSALSDVHSVWNDYATKPDLQAEEKSIKAARRALELDSTLAEAYASLANGLYRMSRWQEADAAFKRSTAMKPSYASAHQWYAWMLIYTGRPEAAATELELALSSDPLSLIINENKGEHLVFMGRFDEAISQLRRTLELDSTFTVTYPALALAYSLAGDHANALRYAERTLARRENSMYDLGHSAFALARAGKEDRAREVLNDMERRSFWAMTAHGHVALGDNDRAIAALEKAYEVGSDVGLLEQLTVQPGTAAIRSHPRVMELRRKLGLTR
jgi:TolB-like protein